MRLWKRSNPNLSAKIEERGDKEDGSRDGERVGTGRTVSFSPAPCVESTEVSGAEYNESCTPNCSDQGTWSARELFSCLAPNQNAPKPRRTTSPRLRERSCLCGPKDLSHGPPETQDVLPTGVLHVDEEFAAVSRV